MTRNRKRCRESSIRYAYSNNNKFSKTTINKPDLFQDKENKTKIEMNKKINKLQTLCLKIFNI